MIHQVLYMKTKNRRNRHHRNRETSSEGVCYTKTRKLEHISLPKSEFDLFCGKWISWHLCQGRRSLDILILELRIQIGLVLLRYMCWFRRNMVRNQAFYFTGKPYSLSEKMFALKTYAEKFPKVIHWEESFFCETVMYQWMLCKLYSLSSN